eukprot:tig00021178_g19196.t1
MGDVELYLADGRSTKTNLYLKTPSTWTTALTCTVTIPELVVRLVPLSTETVPEAEHVFVRVPIALNVSNPVQIQPNQEFAIEMTADLTGDKSVFKRLPYCPLDIPPTVSQTSDTTVFRVQRVASIKCAETNYFDESFVVAASIANSRSDPNSVVPDVCADAKKHYYYSLLVEVDTSSLAPGPYTAKITFTSSAADALNGVVSIRHYVVGGSSVQRHPFIYAKMGVATEQEVTISNPTSGAVTFQAALSGVWASPRDLGPGSPESLASSMMPPSPVSGAFRTQVYTRPILDLVAKQSADGYASLPLSLAKSGPQFFLKATVEMPSDNTIPAGGTATVKIRVLGVGMTDPLTPTYYSALVITASDPAVTSVVPVAAAFQPRFPSLAGPAFYGGPSMYGELVVDPTAIKNMTLRSGVLYDTLRERPVEYAVNGRLLGGGGSTYTYYGESWLKISKERAGLIQFNAELPEDPTNSKGQIATKYDTLEANFEFAGLAPGLRSFTFAVSTSDGFLMEHKMSVFVMGARDDVPETAAVAENCESGGPQSAGTELRSLQEYEFKVLAKNAKGDPVTGAKFVVSYGGAPPPGRRDVCGRSANVPPCLTSSVTEVGGGEYKVKFSIVPRGSSLVNVLLDSYGGLQHIAGSPFPVFILPALNSVPPKLQSAKFTRVGNQIAATFDLPTDRAGFQGAADCARIMALSSPNSTLGERPRCSWIDDKSVLITIGAGATVTSEALESNATIAEPDIVQSPQIAIQAPSKIGSCSPFTVRVAVTGVAGGLISSGWTVEEAPQSLTNILANCTLDGSCTFPAALAAGNYRLRFDATNRFKKSFEKLSMNVPMVTLSGISDGSTRVKTRRNVPTVVVARAKIDTCEGEKSDSGDVAYRWTTPVGSFTGPQIGFPKDYLSVGVFEMTLSVTAPGLPPVTVPVSIDVAAQPVTLTFVGGTAQSVARGATKLIQTSFSDPDLQVGTPTYAWTVNGASVSNSGSSYEFDPASAGSAEKVTITATATLGSRTSNTATLTVAVVPEGTPAVSVTARTTSPLRHNRAFPLPLLGSVKTDKTNVTLLYEAVQGDIRLDDPTTRLTPYNALNMLVAPNVLTPSATYAFRLSATADGLKGYSEAAVTASSPPTPGVCSVSPNKGEEISTVFDISCSGFDTLDESKPLRYQFRAVNSDPASIAKYSEAGVIEDAVEQKRALLDSYTISGLSTDGSVKAILPRGYGASGELAILALCVDVDGASVMYKLGLVTVTVPKAYTDDRRGYVLSAARVLGSLNQLGDTATLLSTLDILSSAFESLLGTSARGLRHRRRALQQDAEIASSLGGMLGMLQATADKLALSAVGNATAAAAGGARSYAPDALEQLSAVSAKLSKNAPLFADGNLTALASFLSGLVASYPAAFPDAAADASAQSSLFAALRSVSANVTGARPPAVSSRVLSLVAASQRQLAYLQRPPVCGADPYTFGNARISTVCAASAGGAGGVLSSVSGGVQVSLSPAGLSAGAGADAEVVLSLETAEAGASPYPTAFSGATIASEIMTVYASSLDGRRLFDGRGAEGAFTFSFNNPPQNFATNGTKAVLLYWNENVGRWVNEKACGGEARRPSNASTAFVATCSHLTTFAFFSAPEGADFSYSSQADSVIMPFSTRLLDASAAAAPRPSAALALLFAALAAVAAAHFAVGGCRGA